jgi:hypothetical protein
MKPGDLVMPKDPFLRMIDPYPINPPPGIVIERVYAGRQNIPGSWRVIWRGERYVMFDNEIDVIDTK